MISLTSFRRTERAGTGTGTGISAHGVDVCRGDDG
jgi:hypothetical protein